MADAQVSGDFPDARPARIGVPSDRQEQLVLGVGESRFGCPALTPAQELAKPGPERQQSRVGCPEILSAGL
ncbi:hypothetical protein [Nocardia gipuzkoensis]